ncbi:diguanylate cyclase domain-containing protein [Sphingomonas fuzhouensis]|uniref:diguanylate cyclase domain-containing protein n=1 Tax=Sphingomonas fuzhouensis TaxID=3106033 RepID=UPI002AFFAEDB|nr:diguanylate cyclase [Sphingomonas sp. SGZ-02]
MMAAPFPIPESLDEERRLATLQAHALLDSEPEAEFDALVSLAADMLGCPLAALILADRDRFWVKSAIGPLPREMPREVAFCDHTIRQTDVMVVPDLAEDPRFALNPFVGGEAGTRFYAGMPIRVPGLDGSPQAIGTLCVMDAAPRSLSPVGEQTLRHLARLAEALIAARAIARRANAMAELSERQAADLRAKDRTVRQVERLALIGSWRITLENGQAMWSEGVYRIHELPPGQEFSVEQGLSYYPPAARDILRRTIAETVRTGAPFDIELDFVTAMGRQRRVRVMGEREMLDGQPHGLIGMFQDVTERHALETQLRRNADTDALTLLANRAAFDRTLEAAIAEAVDSGTALGLVLIDLDGFKLINDTLGHPAGDEVLRIVGQRLRSDWLDGSFVARLGGDEFGVIVRDPALLADTDALRMRIETLLTIAITIEGLTMRCAGTVCVTLRPEDCRTNRDFMHHADSRLYGAKRDRVGERRRSDRRRAG